MVDAPVWALPPLRGAKGDRVPRKRGSAETPRDRSAKGTIRRRATAWSSTDGPRAMDDIPNRAIAGRPGKSFSMGTVSRHSMYQLILDRCQTPTDSGIDQKMRTAWRASRPPRQNHLLKARKGDQNTQRHAADDGVGGRTECRSKPGSTRRGPRDTKRSGLGM
jgi:hypothetical protein